MGWGEVHGADRERRRMLGDLAARDKTITELRDELARLRHDLGTAAVLLTARVEKRDYSLGAWRVVDADGTQLASRQPYPGFSEVALPDIDMPVCADTKRDAEAALADLRATVARRITD